MNTLYPNLYERFKSEGLCPICLMEMELAPRYTCDHEHTICYRCKPYYYSCPICHSSLNIETLVPQGGSSYTPPPTHFMPHPYPVQYDDHSASAPLEEFLEHERNRYPPTPTESEELKSCSYANLGCWVKVPVHLTDLHESRCQFRPHLEEESLPTDVAHIHDDLVECKYRVVGCKMKTSSWRIHVHENYCAYKIRYEAMNDIAESLDLVTITSDEHNDPEDLVECKFRQHGCMVNMPRRRKQTHEEKCNYRQYHQEEEEEEKEEEEVEEEHQSSSENEYDPDEQVPCKWAEHGCRLQPKRSRVATHEEKCNYRMEECAFKDNGCTAVLHPSRKFAHERSCQFND